MFSKYILIVSLLFIGCEHPLQEKEAEPCKPLILVSIAPYKCLVKKIGGDVCRVQTIIPQRSNPHTFEPTAGQVLEISKAQVWFRIGEPFEGKILRLLSPNLCVCDLREAVLCSDDKTAVGEASANHCAHDSLDTVDRHIWLSPKLTGLQASLIAKVLSNYFPDHKDLFQKNLLCFLEELKQLDKEIRSLLMPFRERGVVVSHSAFGYFCREYCLEQLSVEQEGKDPRPLHLEMMMEKAKRFHPAVALALPQHNNKGAQIIAKEMHIPIRTIDPYTDNYFDMMRSLAHLIADPLGEFLP